MSTEDTVDRSFEEKNGSEYDSVLHPPEDPRQHKQPMRSAEHSSEANTNFQSRSLTCRMGNYALELKSNRRPVTAEEKEKAIGLASSSMTMSSFMVVMRPSNVYKGFYLAVPATYARAHLPSNCCKVILYCNSKAWEVRFHLRGSSSRITGGWKKFVMDNNLEEFDVCVFSRIYKITDPVILDVSIFRVVNDVTPPSLITRRASCSKAVGTENLGSEMSNIANV